MTSSHTHSSWNRYLLAATGSTSRRSARAQARSSRFMACSSSLTTPNRTDQPYICSRGEAAVAHVIYALLAGINDYQGRVNSLSGCADDIRGFREFLEGRVDKEHLRILPLVNQDATRENIINGFTGHLASADQDDVAIFYFSGHGSLEPVEELYWY